ncbi:MAG: ADP-forming succinate--CoA ligase subunit beta [Anaerolineae bacterium]
MIVPEDYAKQLLAGYGIPTPAGRVAYTPAEAVAIARETGGAGVVKALIPTGGRGKAGGVKVCSTLEAVQDATRSLLGSDLLGHRVDRVLVEEVIPASREIYAGVAVNSATGMIDLIVSFAGGVEIETAARRRGSGVWRLEIEPGDVLPIHRVYKWLCRVIGDDIDLAELARVLVVLYRAAADLDALLLEINPLAVTTAGSMVALDCKLEIDDNGLARQPELLELYRSSLGERELRARELGVSFVPLDGDIGVITSGAGLGMATLDLVKRAGLSPANFLDTGGGISEALVKGSLELVMEPPGVRGTIINLYGGINRMLEAARGIVAALETMGGDRPVVVKILGNQQEEAWAVLEPHPNVHVIRVIQTEVAVARLAELVG